MTVEQITAFLAAHNWRVHRHAGGWLWATHNGSLRSVQICHTTKLEAVTESFLLQKLA